MDMDTVWRHFRLQLDALRDVQEHRDDDDDDDETLPQEQADAEATPATPQPEEAAALMHRCRLLVGPQ